jgi:hypothetical protein
VRNILAALAIYPFLSADLVELGTLFLRLRIAVKLLVFFFVIPRHKANIIKMMRYAKIWDNYTIYRVTALTPNQHYRRGYPTPEQQ